MTKAEKYARQRASAARTPLLGADEKQRYLKSQSRQREALMRQFINGDGPRGCTEAYRAGWDRIFGKASANG